MIAIAATFLAGTFFGAALYINLVQHPATMATGGDFPGAFFPPMYGRAAPMQITLAVGGTALGVVEWLLGGGVLWLIGSVLLLSVVPITLAFIKPINDQLLEPSSELSPADTEQLLARWSPRHWLRTVASGAAFLCFLTGVALG